ncbi:MAG: alanine--tRNA ligase [Nanoarchaeota archaeon]|nr:alanine--tRNA ligase [Nanoarchaeota archaeon]
MTRKDLIKKYLEFFKSKNHAIIFSAPLVPENNPTVLFTTAGMHPLIPYLLGQKHPSGKRLVDVQKCIRTGDIDEVGDDFHLTFFEMLGNWSLGDYFKEEAIKWSFEFLTNELKIKRENLAVTVFEGDKDAKKDEGSAKIWQSLGMPKEKISFMPKANNWWDPAGTTGPCGPDTEMFFFVGKKQNKTSNPKSKEKEWCEIWNDVFMQYNKDKDGNYLPLKQKNVDTGMGVERTIAVLNGKKSVYDTEMFVPIIKEIENLSEKKKLSENRSARIIADHIRASTFILAEQVRPSNVERGYVLRRLIRKAIRHARLLGIERNFCKEIAIIVVKMYSSDYPELKKNELFISNELDKEENKFMQTLENGLKEFERITEGKKKLGCEEAFLLYQSYGFPFEMISELAKERGIEVNEKEFNAKFCEHQELSRQGAEKKFRGGLADDSEKTARLHTATHLLSQALREVLKKEIQQKGSNITAERLRFDFNFDRKLTDEELKKAEELVNKMINSHCDIIREEMTPEEAKKKGAQGVFVSKYGEKISVYSIGKFSKEICGGPHVKNIKELGKFKIIKEESVAAGVRRIKAILE